MLTKFAIDNLKPRSKRYEVSDGNGLYVVVQPSGRKSFAVRFRIDGRPRKLTLEKGLTLAEARAAAAKAMLEVEKKNDPTVVKRKAKDAQRAAAANTFKAVSEAYLDREGKKKEHERLRSLAWRRQPLERLVYPTLGDRPIGSIKRNAVIELLDNIEDGKLFHPETKEPIRGGATMAHSTLAIIRAIMNWHAVRDEDYRSPIVRRIRAPLWTPSTTAASQRARVGTRSACPFRSLHNHDGAVAKAFRKLKLDPDDPADWRALVEQLAAQRFRTRSKEAKQTAKIERAARWLIQEKIIRGLTKEIAEQNGVIAKKSSLVRRWPVYFT